MIAKHKGEIPVVVLLLPFILGISLGINVLSHADINLLTGSFLLVSIIFILLNITYAKLKLYKIRWLGGILITGILFLFGWLISIRYNELNNKDHFSKTHAQFLIVKINNEPILKNGLLRFSANVEQAVNKKIKSATSGTMLIAIKDSSASKLYYGDELLIPATYNAIDPPFNPAEFNYKNYLANQNIFYQAFLFPKQYAVLATNTGNPLIAYSLRLRQHLIEKLKLNMHDTSAIAVASTLILGYKADLSDDVLQAYSKTGTVHVLSVSGAHVAIIYVLLTLVLGFLDRHKYGKLLKAMIIITLIWYYSMLSGFSPAVCRAAVMISMVIIGKTFNRYINTLNILAISAFVLLIYDPFFLTDVGFQLSYLAVFGLIVLQPVVYNWISIKNKWLDKLWGICSVSVAAQVITFPLSAFYFHQFPVYFLVSNLFIIIPSSIIIYSGIFYLLLPQIPFISKALAYVLENTILIMNKGLAVIEHIPYADISKIWLTIPEYLLLYLIIICVFYFLYDKKTILLKISLVCILLFSISISLKRINQSGINSIAWLNLRKHNGIIFKRGNEAVVLYDLKLTDKTFQYTVQPYLDSCQISKFSTINFDDALRNTWFKKQYNFIQYLNKSVFIFDRELNTPTNSNKIRADYVYFMQNKKDALSNLNTNLAYRLLVVDAGSRNNIIDTIEKQALVQHLNYKLLKRNKSLITVSN